MGNTWLSRHKEGKEDWLSYQADAKSQDGTKGQADDQQVEKMSIDHTLRWVSYPRSKRNYQIKL